MNSVKLVQSITLLQYIQNPFHKVKQVYYEDILYLTFFYVLQQRFITKNDVIRYFKGLQTS